MNAHQTVYELEKILLEYAENPTTSENNAFTTLAKVAVVVANYTQK